MNDKSRIHGINGTSSVSRVNNNFASVRKSLGMRKKKEMANATTSLSNVMQLTGAVGAAIVDMESGMSLANIGGGGLNLDVAAAVQTDGAGGAAYFTPDFMVKYLVMMSKQKYFRLFYDSLPILGRDGSLADIGRDWPAAGKLRAKTGTNIGGDLLNERLVVNGKGLAGYLETKNGKQIVFAVFVNHLPVAGEVEAALKVGDTVAEIAAAAYQDQ